MKKSLYIGLILCLPFTLSAQQKNISQQDLQKQIQDLKEEMQLKISALQDSMAILQKQLMDQSQRNEGNAFNYQNPDQEKEKAEELQDLLRDHAFSYGYKYNSPGYEYQYKMPTPFDYHLVIPPGSDNYQYDWKQLEMTPCPDAQKNKHKHEWMKMLPFGGLFKN